MDGSLIAEQPSPTSAVPVWAGEGAARLKRAVAKKGSDLGGGGGRGWKEFLEKKDVLSGQRK